jgi:hypothetical protein
VAPALYALLSRINFLSAPDETHASAPISMPSHDFKYETWLGFLAAELLLALIRVPRTLGFIKNDCIFVWANTLSPA